MLSLLPFPSISFFLDNKHHQSFPSIPSNPPGPIPSIQSNPIQSNPIQSNPIHPIRPIPVRPSHNHPAWSYPPPNGLCLPSSSRTPPAPVPTISCKKKRRVGNSLE
ncbi:hypothetical protein K440DRAFT_155255 [Wilcoxina mikolae CBS 423.85]|nr:hypothetical protein K440DRAFT_155255 [Wilcoxina mikolae CBS 423.85]